MPNKMGMNRTATTTRARVADSSGRRIMMPQSPPGERREHEQAQRAKRQSQDKHESEKIRWIKLLRPFDGANHANQHADYAGDERALAETIDAFRRFVVLPV